MKRTEVWHHNDGRLRTFMWNPCGCCPKSVISYWGNRFHDSGSYYFKTRQEQRDWMNGHGWYFLGYL